MNPSLPGGAGDADLAGEVAGGFAAAARLAYTFVPYDRLQQGRADAPNPSELGIDVHLGTIQLSLSTPTRTTIDVQLPAGNLTTRQLGMTRTDRGVGDLELRLQQRTAPARRSRASFGAAAGAVLPTGAYVARSGAAQLPPEASTLTLGRGVAWWLAELDARLPVEARGDVAAQLSARGPLGRTDDDFGWGPEVRGSLGGRGRIGAWLDARLTGDVQWRAGATEPDPFAGGRIDSANVGGWQLTAIPSITARLPGGVAVSLGLRIPLVTDVTGNQLVPGTGAFLAVGHARPLSRSRSRPRAGAAPIVVAAATGRFTVVDYWATWCAPCAEIDRALTAAAPGWPDVDIRRVDMTHDDPALTLPAGARGLPVIEIFDARGQRVALLEGARALDVVDVVDRLRAAQPGGTP